MHLLELSSTSSTCKAKSLLNYFKSLKAQGKTCRGLLLFQIFLKIQMCSLCSQFTINPKLPVTSNLYEAISIFESMEPITILDNYFSITGLRYDFHNRMTISTNSNTIHNPEWTVSLIVYRPTFRYVEMWYLIVPVS